MAPLECYQETSPQSWTPRLTGLECKHVLQRDTGLISEQYGSVEERMPLYPTRNIILAAIAYTHQSAKSAKSKERNVMLHEQPLKTNEGRPRAHKRGFLPLPRAETRHFFFPPQSPTSLLQVLQPSMGC